MNEDQWLNSSREMIEQWLREDMVGDEPVRQAMRYSVLAGGKRLRPLLVLASGYLLDIARESLREAALAIEYLHTYSLIHDDLPAMDNDDLRRGKPTSHKVFGEALAILAGDALLTEAFLRLAGCDHFAPQRVLAAVRRLGRAAGSRGLIAGQEADLRAEGQKNLSGEELTAIHERKTAQMIMASVQIPAMLGGDAVQAGTLETFGRHFGLMFQAMDDILNVIGNPQQLGKATGSDAVLGKATAPAVWGMERARAYVAEQGELAHTALGGHPRAEMLQALLDAALVRQR